MRNSEIKLCEQQKERLSKIPALYRKIFERAFLGRSKAVAIKAFCLECNGDSRVEAEKCTCRTCPLFAHNPYKKRSSKLRKSQNVD